MSKVCSKCKVKAIAPPVTTSPKPLPAYIACAECSPDAPIREDVYVTDESPILRRWSGTIATRQRTRARSRSCIEAGAPTLE
jgi:hypothetical protein